MGGGGGIRTHETLSGLPVFKTGAFNRSATHPEGPLIAKLSAKSELFYATGLRRARNRGIDAVRS